MGERKLLGPEIVQATVDKVNIMQAKFRAAQERQKSYADVGRKDLEFKYISDPLHMLETLEIELRDDFSYEEQPMQILGREEKRLHNKTIALVKVLWRNHLVQEATWEQEDPMRSQYPYLFQN
ncbi:uncharacterized protein LOC132800672 [Ziziphus jujuba]|uniref:Uncharacterized protein LOC132800672 n=1 Tax=Ziziphus jujuba TaxID=326968 RepID=A0ABM4A2B1_ZIZJJ|nr:uncharacterized protein LOC132800672 [Ziziphus jujuba]